MNAGMFIVVAEFAPDRQTFTCHVPHRGLFIFSEMSTMKGKYSEKN